MVLMVANSLVMWVLLGGLLGPWVFLVLPINFLCNYTTVKCLYKFKKAVNKREEKDMESGQEMTEVSKQNQSLRTKTLGTGCEMFFPLKSSLTALWLPAVVGDHPSLFMATVVTTLVTKILFLVLALTLAFSGYQQHVFPHPITLWCEEEWSLESVRGDITLCSFDSVSTGLAPCFELNPIKSGVQKLRVCGSEDEEFILQISLLVIVIFLNCLSLGAAVWLNKITNYIELFQSTKTLFWCIPTKPVIHRSSLHQLVISNKEEDYDILEEMLQLENIGAVVNRPNWEYIWQFKQVPSTLLCCGPLVPNQLKI